MIDPKIFYRELDAILKKIGKGGADEDQFFAILQEMDQSFGKKLNIINGHIFELRGEKYVEIHTVHKDLAVNIPEEIPAKAESVRKMIVDGVTIVEDLMSLEDWQNEWEKNEIKLAIIHVHKSVKKWFIIFQIVADKITEDLLLFLNSMRTALNYRLFSDMMSNDLRRAEEIQRSLLPTAAPKISGYDIFGRSVPAEVVGGDFYEYIQFDGSDFGVAIGDASGHGIPAALLVRDVVIGLRMGMAKDMRLVYTIKKLNQVIQQSTYSTNFVSLFVGEFESDGHLFYVNAGHPAPFLVSGDSIYDLPATGITLGFTYEIDLRRAYIRMKPGSVLVMFTDGIVEREKKEDEQFEVERLKEIVVYNQYKSAEEIVELIFQAVYAFGSQKSLEDDATVVVIKKI
jgi:phosphoserine phosphatase RsbU/P